MHNMIGFTSCSCVADTHSAFLLFCTASSESWVGAWKWG